MGSRICIRAVSMNTKMPHPKTVLSTIDNIAPLRFVDEAVDQARVEARVGVDYAGVDAFARARNSSKVCVALGLTANTIPSWQWPVCRQ